MDFCEFVAIKQSETPETTLDYKAISSFSKVVCKYVDLGIDDQLRVWIATMIDKGISSSTRKRYVEKLNTLYRNFTADISGESDYKTDPFISIKTFRDVDTTDYGITPSQPCRRLDEIFNRVMSDAVTSQPLALFLYMLFNATADISQAISLQTEDYKDRFPQLDGIIDTSLFHHRRKYVFNLNQSRKRLPQLTREVELEINDYLEIKGIKFKHRFKTTDIISIWINKAREAGIKLTDIAGTISMIPEEYGYLRYINTAPLSDNLKFEIKKIVAEAFWPSDERWYAMKLHRGTSYDELNTMIDTESTVCRNNVQLFYPMRLTYRKIGKRMVKEQTPFIEDVVFLQTRLANIVSIDRKARREGLGWIFRQSPTPGSEYSIVDRHAMTAFQRAIGVYTSDIRIGLTAEKPIGVGRKVRITGGAFAGYAGMIYDTECPGSDDMRYIFIRLSNEYGIKVELKIEDCLVEPLE